MLGKGRMNLIRIISLFLTILLLSCTSQPKGGLDANKSAIGGERRGLELTKKTIVTDATKRTALVIGNSDYSRISGLKNPVNDATDLAEKLKRLNFKLVNNQALLNANKREIKLAVREFKQLLKQGGVGVFFYAGHGMQINGTNYLIPLGTDFQSKADVENDAIKLNWVLAELEDAANPINFILLDACRDNPFRGFRGGSKGLAESRAPVGSLISFATSPGSVARDGLGERNSPYTKGLLAALDQKGLEVLSMFKAVRRSVKNSTYNKQVPWESHSLTEDIYLNGKPVNKALEQEVVLKQLREIREQQRVTEKQLQQAQKQQQIAQNAVQKKQADSALAQARATAKRIRAQAKSIGVNIEPSVLEQSTKNDFEKALLYERQQFMLVKQKNDDTTDYAQAKIAHTVEGYLRYLKNCSSPCAYSDQAEEGYKLVLIELDVAAFDSAKKQNSIAGYRYYLQKCNSVCAYQKIAQNNLKIVKKFTMQVKQDAEYYVQALKIATAPALAAYLTSCQVCLEAKGVKGDWHSSVIKQLPTRALKVLTKKSVQKTAMLAKEIIDRGVFYDNKDGTVTDLRTGLQWMRCSLGQVWENNACMGEIKKYKFKSGLFGAGDDLGDALAGFRYAEHSDWRVPNIKELNSLVYCSNGKKIIYGKNGYESIESEGSYGCNSDVRENYVSPTIMPGLFPNTSRDEYWSMSIDGGDLDSAWLLDFGDGYDGSFDRRDRHYVRLVRDSQ